MLTDCVLIAVYEMNSRWERSNMHPLVDLQLTMLHLKIRRVLVLKSNLLYRTTWKQGKVGRSRVVGQRKGECEIVGFVHEIVFLFIFFDPSFPISYSYFSVA